ncbi:alanine racemase [Chromohalobacter marismortui]|uniref:Alanine racemase n=1 Tax=Chromohalobacter marismortui TaxID=42055 RepID=A0A4R7NM03_9GAMM|nr:MULTISPECIES: alanine racemase [Chromohalobacter]MCI0510114.1 alanine racemase [Chromohalobacter sp.]MCI0594825.1 alanine racemase [Chromohalobacter sp.]TDU21529.1 alanine racemase [Chromohalobacter marismortui]
MSRPLIADIDLGALRDNYRLARDRAPHSRALAVLKADAYGHGATQCALALADMAPAFAVASLEEAVALRDAGITQPIMLLEGFFDAAELPLIDAHRLWVAVHSDWQIDALLAYHPRQPIPTWLKLDSGMHRLGVAPEMFVARWQRLKAASTQVTALHLMTHFATADALDPTYFRRQMTCIETLRQRLEAPICLANSPATLAWPEAHGDWTRPGVMLYGSDPLEGANDASRALKPVMTLRSELIAVRELATGEVVGYGGRWKASRPSRIGVVACGYGDGYDRHAQDGTPVLVEGQRVPLAGKVSMDMLTVDLTDVPEADVGSRVVLWGEGLSVDEVARYCDTISYTLLTGLLPRVPRRYRNAEMM